MNATPRSPLRDLTSSTTLRDYQRDAVRNVLEALHEHRRVVLQMPTASGKTFTAMELLKALRQRGPVWFVCHRQEIINQTKEAMEEHEIEFGVISPRAEADPAQLVQVASVQSLRNRWQNYPAPAVIIWDECHHAVAKTWAEWFDRFPDAWHLGLTATPERLDGKPLSALFAHMVCGPSTRWLIDNGRLSPFKIFTQRSEDREKALQALRAGKGDYRPGDLDRVMNTPVLIGDALEHYQRLASGKRALAFCVNREASKALVAKFTEAGIPAMHVDMETPDDARKAAVEALRSGDLKLISNVDVFTEGVDIPALDAVILMRPTRSLALYLQMVGRVLRRCEGKETAIILDHAGFFWQQPDPADDYEWSLSGGARQRRVLQIQQSKEKLLICPNCGFTHKASKICAECGFEYPKAERDRARFEGYLISVASRGEPEEGAEPIRWFAKRIGVGHSAVIRWVQSGMPMSGGYIDIDAATRWLFENGKAYACPKLGDCDPSAHSTYREFAARHNVSETLVKAWLVSGLPTARNGRINTTLGDEWVASNWKKRKIRWWAKYGINQNQFYRFSSMGMPEDPSPSSEALCDAVIGWLRDHHNRPIACAETGGYEHIFTFAKRHNLPQTKAVNLIKSRVLTATGAHYVISDEADAAYAAHRMAFAVHYQAPEAGCVYGAQLARLLGKKEETIRVLKKRGLPVNASGHIPLRQALAWIENNTKISIPPSAWEGVEPAE